MIEYRPWEDVSLGVFLMLSCIATSSLVHNGGYLQKLLQFFNSTEILQFERPFLVTKTLLKVQMKCFFIAEFERAAKVRKAAVYRFLISLLVPEL